MQFEMTWKAADLVKALRRTKAKLCRISSHQELEAIDRSILEVAPAPENEPPESMKRVTTAPGFGANVSHSIHSRAANRSLRLPRTRDRQPGFQNAIQPNSPL